MKKILLSSVLFATITYASMDTIPAEKRTFEQSKFTPDISLIMDGSFVNRNIKDDEVVHLELPGIAHGIIGSHDHDGASHSSYNANNGFNLNYAELVLSSSVDPSFTMDSVFHFSPDSVEIEELYFTTTALENGIRIKGGKFNSNFGYINEQHHHSWSFGDMPLVNEAFLGMHGINEAGLQLQWTAPTSTYLMLGAEILQGENEQMFGNSSMGGDEENPLVESETAPSLLIAYAKTSFDIGDTTLLAGISYAGGSSRLDHSSDEESPHLFAGDSSVYGADLTVKHYFDSYSSLTWQSEFLKRDMDGVQYNLDSDGAVLGQPDLTKEQSGIYSQLVYVHDKNYQMGLRYDSIFQNDIQANSSTVDKANNLNRYSAMLEYHTSEFARFRLQYNHNKALYNEDEEQETINTLMLQVNISIGAHAAHSF